MSSIEILMRLVGAVVESDGNNDGERRQEKLTSNLIDSEARNFILFNLIINKQKSFDIIETVKNIT